MKNLSHVAAACLFLLMNWKPVGGLEACPGDNITLSCEVNVVGSLKIVTDNSCFEFFSGDESNQIEDPPSLITTEITPAWGQFSNFSVDVQTIASENASLTCYYTDREGEQNQTASVVLTNTSVPTIANITQGGSSEVVVTLDPPAEGSECVEDYIIQYRNETVSTDGNLSVVIENMVFYQQSNFTFNVMAVLKDGSFIDGRDYILTLGDDGDGDDGDGDDGDGDDGDNEGILIGVLSGIGVTCILVVVVLGVFTVLLVKFCPKKNGSPMVLKQPASLPQDKKLESTGGPRANMELVEAGGCEPPNSDLPPTNLKKGNMEEEESASRKDRQVVPPVYEAESVSFVKEATSTT